MKPTFFLTALLAFSLPHLLAAGDRVALVVGVDTYEKLGAESQLRVAVSDAERMAATLRAVEPPFRVTLAKETDWRTAQAKFDAFLDEAKGAECALVYFAGHGIEYHGENFLLVKDSDVSDISADVERMKRRLATAAVSLQGWVDSLETTKAQVKVVILDCCRDNPLQAADGTGTRSVVGGRRGLAQVTPPSGTLISYSADAGQSANDGLFTEVLTKNLAVPGLSIVKVFAKTREEVRQISTEWAAEDVAKNVEASFRRPRHEPAEYNKLDLAGTDFTFTRGAVKIAETLPDAAARDKEMADMRAMVAKLTAESTGRLDQAAEIAALKAQLAELGRAKAKEPAPQSVPATVMTPPAFPATPVQPPATRGAVLDSGKIGDGWDFDVGKGQKVTVRYVPGGEFLMGSPADEAERSEDEAQVQVTLSSHYWLGETEVTQALWESVMGSNPSDFKGADLPVENVSWEDVQEFIGKLNAKGGPAAGWKWSLPTEAQWERACRGGTETTFSFGNSLDSTQANFDGNYPYGNGKKGPYLDKAAAVKSYKKNAYGLYDMHGNVYEWCLDWYGEKLEGGTNPTGAKTGSDRVLRGGSWGGIGGGCRSAYRDWGTPDDRNSRVGIRLAVVLVER